LIDCFQLIFPSVAAAAAAQVASVPATQADDTQSRNRRRGPGADFWTVYHRYATVGRCSCCCCSGRVSATQADDTQSRNRRRPGADGLWIGQGTGADDVSYQTAGWVTPIFATQKQYDAIMGQPSQPSGMIHHRHRCPGRPIPGLCIIGMLPADFSVSRCSCCYSSRWYTIQESAPARRWWTVNHTGRPPPHFCVMSFLCC